MDEKYTYNGQEYSRADLEAKYGDKVDDAISKFGFELVQTSDKSDSDKEQIYSYGGVDYTESQLNDKYGDKVNQAIEKFGIKKKIRHNQFRHNQFRHSQRKHRTLLYSVLELFRNKLQCLLQLVKEFLRM